MKTKQILEILKVLAWIIFIGLCIRTGAMIISAFVSLFVNPQGAGILYSGLNLSDLLTYSQGYYIRLVSLVIFLSGLKAYLFFLVIKIISKISVTHPFSEQITSLIYKLSTVSLQIGILAVITNSYAKWLLKQPVQFSFEGGGTEFLFLAGILYVVMQIFKRGIELQNENELTI
jgi:hypothetical protein